MRTQQWSRASRGPDTAGVRTGVETTKVKRPSEKHWTKPEKDLVVDSKAPIVVKIAWSPM